MNNSSSAKLDESAKATPLARRTHPLIPSQEGSLDLTPLLRGVGGVFLRQGLYFSRRAQTHSYLIYVFFIVLTIGATSLTACSADNPPVRPTNESVALSTPSAVPLAKSDSNSDSSTAIQAQPPAAILSNGRGQTEAALGSYCWHFDETSPIECDNVFNISAPTNPLVVLPSQKLTIHLPDKPIMLVTMRVLEWQKIEAAAAEGETAIALDAPVVASGDLEPQSTIEWEAPPMAGQYMLDLMSVYENEGHVAYGWHILVE